jgi:polyhydroxyalkanoate synthesis regulator protein
MNDTTDMVAVPQFLEQLGREFIGLSDEIERLQDTISELLGAASLDPRLMQQAQALDHVFQHTRELSAILTRAAENASPGWVLPKAPILSAVSLSGLASRLEGRPAEAGPSGDCELF